MEVLIELHNSWRQQLCLTFREVSVAIILNLFWVDVRGILPQILSNLHKSFTSDAIKSSQKHEFLILRAFQFTLSWRYIIVVSFIRIAFVVVKLKIPKDLRTDSASTKQAFLGGFWALTFPIWSNIVEIFTRGSTVANKNKFWKAFEEFEYLWKRDGPKVSIFGPTLTHLFLLKMAKIEKISSSSEKRQPLSYPNMSKWSLYLPSPFREKYD